MISWECLRNGILLRRVDAARDSGARTIECRAIVEVGISNSEVGDAVIGIIKGLSEIELEDWFSDVMSKCYFTNYAMKKKWGSKK